MADVNAGYVPGFFPRSGDFDLDESDFSFLEGQTYGQLRPLIHELMLKYQSNYSPYQDSTIRFSVNFNNGMEFVKYMSELMSLLRRFGIKEERFSLVWKTCQHGRFYNNMMPHWKLVRDGSNWTPVRSICRDCNTAT